jgi:S-adenosylmethionine hydrolase
LVTNIRVEWIPTIYEELKARILVHGQWLSVPFLETYGRGRLGTAISLVGSSGWVEVAIVNGDAKNHLKASVGDRVVVAWKD